MGLASNPTHCTICGEGRMGELENRGEGPLCFECRKSVKNELFFAYGIFRYDYTRSMHLQKRVHGWIYCGERRVNHFSIYTSKLNGLAHARPYFDGHINGSLWSITPRHLSELDAIEGHPVWYRRIEVVTDHGEIAWLYVQQDAVEDWYDMVRVSDWPLPEPQKPISQPFRP